MNRIRLALVYLAILAAAFSAVPARADVTLPLDVSTASTTLASYVAPAGGFGLVVAVAILGCIIVWRIFKRLAKG